MTLTTQMLVIEPTPYRPVFDAVRRLIGADKASYVDEPGVIKNRYGQGFPAWIGVVYGTDAPLEPGLEEAAWWPVARWSIEVHLDTAGGYRAANGAGCSDLHAYLVQELGRWLSDRGLTWFWYHEYTGEWHPSSDPITILGDPERGRLN